ncbi:MAG: chloride channel protein [Lachnospiraceae bacterium]|nr:chloride channel protein [Lachnospiraceae bacterium]
MKKAVKSKNRFVFIIFCMVIGAIIGGIIWAFMRVMHLLIELLWHYIPSVVNIPFYTIILCLAGGVVIGLIQKYHGPCPDELTEVMKEYKQNGRYHYNNIPFMLFAAILPLIFGGAIGPEAGLTGVIVGLCCWAGDNFKSAGKYLAELPDIGISATLGVLFHSPLFGFIEPLEEEDEDFVLPKPVKMTAIFCTLIAALGAFVVLSNLLGSAGEMPRFDTVKIGNGELLFAVPILIIAIIYGFIYLLFEKMTRRVSEALGKKYFISAMIAALILGVVGTVFPLAMFSGEQEIITLGETYAEYAPYVLLAIAFIKLFLINTCINLGWRGGSFFPSIFAGVCLGYACAMLFHTDITFSVAVASAAVMTTIMKKPLAVTALLLICFPVQSMLYIFASAFLASVVANKKAVSEESQ